MENEVKEMFNVLLNEIKGLKTEVSELKSEVGELKSEVGELKSDMEDLKTRVDQNTTELRELRAIVETDLRHNIQVIAEGHGFQTEKYNDIQKVVEQVRARQELTEIRLRMIESDIKSLKRA